MARPVGVEGMEARTNQFEQLLITKPLGCSSYAVGQPLVVHDSKDSGVGTETPEARGEPGCCCSQGDVCHIHHVHCVVSGGRGVE